MRNIKLDEKRKGSMKKRGIRIVCFLLIFSFVFIKIQDVLHYRWTGNEDLYTRNLDYINQMEDSIDVLCFGTSELYAGYDPIVTYHEAGITGYNFAISYRSAVTAYYQLLFALKYQTPQVVMCDFSCLFDNQLPNEVEELYRKVVDTMPDRKIKNQLIKEICLLDSNQSYISWKYPLFRYHSMWNTLNESNFVKDYVYDESYPTYQKGSLMNVASYDDMGLAIQIEPELWNYDIAEDDFSSISVKYYDLFIDACKERGIQVVALLPPKLNKASEQAARWEAMKEYFDSRGVECLNYNTYEQVIRLGVSLEEDYYNAAHLNIKGSIKFSKIIADDLRSRFNFKDRSKNEKLVNDWNGAWDEFKTYVDSITTE